MGMCQSLRRDTWAASLGRRAPAVRKALLHYSLRAYVAVVTDWHGTCTTLFLYDNPLLEKPLSKEHIKG
jgi:hypothetical protein